MTTGVGMSFRVTLSLGCGLFVGITTLLLNMSYASDSQYLNIINFFIIPVILLPLVTLFANYLVKYYSCKQVNVMTLASGVISVPIYFLILAAVLKVFPWLLWPIEGMFDLTSPEQKIFARAFAYAYFFFWATSYNQESNNASVQRCPRV
jgi:hypothetical protein